MAPLFRKYQLINFWGSSPNNPFALLDIVDCTSETAKGGKKDAKYITRILKPIISWIEETKDPNNQKTDHQELLTWCCLMVLAMCRMPRN
jgi:hypothetical protein